jgi:hypothetical protein
MSSIVGMKVIQATTATAGAAGTTAINGSAVDLSGWDEIMILVPFGTIVSGAATSIKWQEGSTASPTTDVLGTAMTVLDTEDDTTKCLRIIKPRSRYGRVVVSRATQNATVGAIYYILSGASTQPATDDTTVVQETHVSPAAGTA